PTSQPPSANHSRQCCSSWSSVIPFSLTLGGFFQQNKVNALLGSQCLDKTAHRQNLAQWWQAQRQARHCVIDQTALLLRLWLLRLVLADQWLAERHPELKAAYSVAWSPPCLTFAHRSPVTGSMSAHNH